MSWFPSSVAREVRPVNSAAGTSLRRRERRRQHAEPTSPPASAPGSAPARSPTLAASTSGGPSPAPPPPRPPPRPWTRSTPRAGSGPAPRRPISGTSGSGPTDTTGRTAPRASPPARAGAPAASTARTRQDRRPRRPARRPPAGPRPDVHPRPTASIRPGQADRVPSRAEADQVGRLGVAPEHLHGQDRPPGRPATRRRPSRSQRSTASRPQGIHAAPTRKMMLQYWNRTGPPNA